MDLDPFETIGINASTVAFLDVFLMHCLLTPSPPDTPQEISDLARNQELTAGRGREPGLRLSRGGREMVLTEWVDEVLKGCATIAQALDEHGDGSPHQEAVTAAMASLRDPGLLPSARVLQTTASFFDGSYIRFVRERSATARLELLADPWSPELQAKFLDMSAKSTLTQDAAEAADDLPFEEFRQRYLDVSQLTPLDQ
jgi:glutamate--cysteine ligase